MLKKIIQKTIRAFNIFFFRRSLPKKICIYFHDVSDQELNELENIIQFFQHLKYKFSTLETINTEIESNSKLINISFDDGFKGWVKAVELFDKYKIKCTFFLNTALFTEVNLQQYCKQLHMKSSDEYLLLNKEEFSIIIQSGHEIGSHTHRHFKLNTLNQQELDYEINKNLELLTKNNKLTVNTFAIPYGMRRFISRKQIIELKKKFTVVCFGEPGMLFNHKKGEIQRYPWISNNTFYSNLVNLSTDSSLFNSITKRSGIG